MIHTNAEIARHLHVSPSIVTLWRKRKPPIPNDSLEGAARWRANYAPARGRRVADLAQVEQNATRQPTTPTTNAMAPASDTSWKARLERARKVELQVFDAIQQSIGTGDLVSLGRLQAVHVACSKEIGDLELVALECEERAENLIPSDTVREMFNGLLTPLRQAMDKLPIAEAHHCNPNNPEVARKTLKRWVERTLVSCHREAGRLFQDTPPAVPVSGDTGSEPMSSNAPLHEETETSSRENMVT